MNNEMTQLDENIPNIAIDNGSLLLISIAYVPKIPFYTKNQTEKLPKQI
jgi:hypothetical protein